MGVAWARLPEAGVVSRDQATDASIYNPASQNV